ncbi:MAG: hypothetical protein D6731_26200, partial [Planctomycetota bacterium]
ARRRRSAPARRSDEALRAAIETAERELLSAEPTPGRWLTLARLRLRAGDASEALRAYECALWELRGAAGQEAWDELRAALDATPERGAPPVLDLARRTLAYPTEAAAAADAEAFRQATQKAYERLERAQDRLRKRTRWLLWEVVLAVSGDALEFERQREAILGDLVVRGVEEHEVPPFVRRLLLARHGEAASGAAGASGAAPLLRQAQRLSEELSHPALRAHACAETAWGLAELGQAEAARELAERAVRTAARRGGAPPLRAWRVRARARAAAVWDHAQAGGSLDRLAEVLDDIAKLLAKSRKAEDEGERFDTRRALIEWLRCLADVAPGGVRGAGALAEEGLALLRPHPPTVRLHVVQEAADALETLDRVSAAQELIADLLRPDALRAARRAVQNLRHPDHAYRIHIQNAVETVARLSGEDRLPSDDAQRFLALVRAQPELLIDEFSVPALRLALRALPEPAWPAAATLTGEIRRRGARYEAEFVRIAGLWELARERAREQGAALLLEALREAWELPSTPDKPAHRVLTRLVALVPAFGLRDRGLEVLREVHEKVEARAEEGAYFRNELLISTALAGAKLGESRGAFDLLSETARLALAEVEQLARTPETGEANWLLFETLDVCVAGAVELGENRRGLELVAAVARAALDSLERFARARPAAQDEFGYGLEATACYFFCQTLLRCGAAAGALGSPDAADAHFAAAFAHLDALSSWDLTAFLGEAAAVAGELEGARRHALAGRVLESAAAPLREGTQDRFGVDLVSRVVRDAVRGESAYAAALKRWKAREELRIRDRVVRAALPGD